MANDNNLNEKLSQFCSNMAELEEMTEMFSDFQHQLMEEPDNGENVWKKLDANLTFAYANTTIFYLYLMLKETKLAGHPIHTEIARLRKYMEEYELLKKEAPKLNVQLASNYIRNALWDPTRKCKRTIAEAEMDSKKKSKRDK